MKIPAMSQRQLLCEKTCYLKFELAHDRFLRWPSESNKRKRDTAAERCNMFFKKMKTTKLDKLVFSALTNAVQNGYNEVVTNDPNAVAEDVLACDADVEKAMANTPEAIKLVASSVKRWRLLSKL